MSRSPISQSCTGWCPARATWRGVARGHLFKHGRCGSRRGRFCVRHSCSVQPGVCAKRQKVGERLVLDERIE